jgi:WD40 repeat protein
MQFCDENTLLTSSLDGTVQMWAAMTGQRTKVFEGVACASVIVQPVTRAPLEQTKSLLEASEPIVKAIFISSQREGVLAALSHRASPKIAPFGKDHGGVSHADFSPSGSYFTASHEDGSCTVHSAAGGAVLWQLNGHSSRANCALFAGSDGLIVSCGRDRLVMFWRLPPISSTSAPVLVEPLFSLPFDLEIARMVIGNNAVVFASLDSQLSSCTPCVSSNGVLKLGGSLSLCFDAGLLKYLSVNQDSRIAANKDKCLFSRYVLPPVWVLERIMASSNVGAKQQLRCLLQGPAAGNATHCQCAHVFVSL